MFVVLWVNFSCLGVGGVGSWVVLGGLGSLGRVGVVFGLGSFKGSFVGSWVGRGVLGRSVVVFGVVGCLWVWVGVVVCLWVLVCVCVGGRGCGLWWCFGGVLWCGCQKNAQRLKAFL